MILVKYGPQHSYFNEWVYNDADIDAAKVIWARAMDDPSEDCKVVQYFSDRAIWSLTIDQDDSPVRLEPIRRESCQ